MFGQLERLRDACEMAPKGIRKQAGMKVRDSDKEGMGKFCWALEAEIRRSDSVQNTRSQRTDLKREVIEGAFHLQIAL